MALLSGLYEEYEGKVMVNDLSIDMIQLEKYRSMVGDVLEMEQIFHGTIRENIIVGREYDDKQLESVLELVDLKEYVYQLPNDLETKLQPEGKGLSKRIIQSILVARALIGKPKAIIMENALLHLYEDVKNRILDYLIKGDWTLILVTKDEEAIKRVDEIIVMDQGKNVFQGNHEGYLSFTSNSN